jgi:hypothetical protein
MGLQSLIVVFWLPDFVVEEDYAFDKCLELKRFRCRDRARLTIDKLGKSPA